jgi:hypothetical protein
MAETHKSIGWAVWHPKYGFEVPCEYEGAIAYADLGEDIVSKVRSLNKEAGTTNRTGWRAVKVALVKV